MGIYVGEEVCIDLEDGTKFYILKDLSQGAEDDLTSYDIAQGGQGGTIWNSKLLELAITRIVNPEGEEHKPTIAEVRRMLGSVTAQLREEVMSRWYPLAWEQIKRLTALEPETPIPADSGEQSTTTEDLVTTPQTG